MTLDASKLPTIDNGEAIRQATKGLTDAGQAVETLAGRVHGIWQGLGSEYHAPEQHLVLQAMNTPQTKAKDLSDKADKAGTALTTYANRCDELEGQRKTLVTDIGTFYKKKADKESSNDNPWEWAKDKSGWDDFSLLREEEGLLGRANQLQADLDEAQRTCANAIGAIYGGPTWEAVGQASVEDKTVFGMTKDGYEEMAKSGDTPWGAPEGWKGGSWLSEGYMVTMGAWDTIASTGGFLWDLTGLSEDGEAAAAWSGIWQLTKDAARYSSPFALAVSATLDPTGTKESGERLLNVGKATIGWGKWDDSPYQTAGGFVPDIIAAVASGGTSAAARGSMKAAMSGIVRHVPGAAGKIDDLAAASRAMKASMAGTLDKLSFGHLNFDTPTPAVRPDVDLPNVDAPRPDAPHVGVPDRTPDAGTPDRTPDAGTPDRTPDRTPDAGTPDRTPDADGAKPDADQSSGPGTPDADVPSGHPDAPEAGKPDGPDADGASETPDSGAANPAGPPSRVVPEPRTYTLLDGSTHHTNFSPEQAAFRGTPWRDAIQGRMEHHGWDDARLQTALDTRPDQLPVADRRVLDDLRQQVRFERDTPLARVIPNDVVERQIAGDWPYPMDSTTGFTARAVDTADMTTPQALFDRLALDYDATPHPYRADGQDHIPRMGGAQAVDEMHVLRFDNADPDNFYVPRDSVMRGESPRDANGDLDPRKWNGQARDNMDPYTGNGWTRGPGGVPEFYPHKPIQVPEGAEMWRVNAAGDQQLRAVLKNVNGTPQWVEVL